MAKANFSKQSIEKNPNKLFRKLTGQVIKKLSVKGNSDQHFRLVTDKINLKFGANDLGVWVEEYNTK